MSDPNRESDAEMRARRGRNIALAVGLLLFVVLVFVVTLARLGADVANRPL
jgi:ABC-type transporter Mla subunit MlaD